MQPALNFSAPLRQSLCDVLADYFRQHPHQWIDARTVLMPLGGFGGWRTRCSELRTKHGMDIRNRWRTVTDGRQRWRVSEYCFHPKEL